MAGLVIGSFAKAFRTRPPSIFVIGFLVGDVGALKCDWFLPLSITGQN